MNIPEPSCSQDSLTDPLELSVGVKKEEVSVYFFVLKLLFLVHKKYGKIFFT